MSLNNAIARNICRYYTIFPTVESVIQHWIIVIGNGYTLDDKGIFEDSYNEIGLNYIHETEPIDDDFVEMSINDNTDAVKRMYGDERPDLVVKKHDESKKRCRIYTIEDFQLTAESLHQDLILKHMLYKHQFRQPKDDYYLRCYPFSETYSIVHNITADHPRVLIDMSIEFCKAWARYLNDEIYNKHWDADDSKHEGESQTKQQHQDFVKTLARLETL